MVCILWRDTYHCQFHNDLLSLITKPEDATFARVILEDAILKPKTMEYPLVLDYFV